jgi:hypothetical protein
VGRQCPCTHRARAAEADIAPSAHLAGVLTGSGPDRAYDRNEIEDRGALRFVPRVREIMAAAEMQAAAREAAPRWHRPAFPRNGPART